MANLYEGDGQSMMGEVQNLDLDTNKIADTVNGAVPVTTSDTNVCAVNENAPISIFASLLDAPF